MANNTNLNAGFLGCLFWLFLILGFGHPIFWLFWLIGILVSVISLPRSALINSQIEFNEEKVGNQGDVAFNFTQIAPDDLQNILQDLSNGEIRDPLTQEIFSPGEKVNLCHVHRLAYHEDSWKELGNKCMVCGSNIHTKTYILPSLGKSIITQDIEWEDLPLNEPEPIDFSRLGNQHLAEAEELLVSNPHEDLEPINLSDSRRQRNIISGEREIILEDDRQTFITSKKFEELYLLIDNLTQMPVLGVKEVEQVLHLQFAQYSMDLNSVQFHALRLAGTNFSGVELLQRPNQPLINQLSLMLASDLNIPFFEVYRHYYNGYNIVTEPHKSGTETPYSFTIQNFNFQVMFNTSPRSPEMLKSILIYPSPLWNSSNSPSDAKLNA